MKIGWLVKVLPPFDVAFSETYKVCGIKKDGTCVICEDRDFDPRYLGIVAEQELSPKQPQPETIGELEMIEDMEKNSNFCVCCGAELIRSGE